MRENSRNPFIGHEECTHEPFQILWPVGSYGSMDVWRAMELIDKYLEDGDVLAARQLLWDVGVTMEAPYRLSKEQVDDAVFSAYTENIVKDIEKELGA